MMIILSTVWGFVPKKPDPSGFPFAVQLQTVEVDKVDFDWSRIFLEKSETRFEPAGSETRSSSGQIRGWSMICFYPSSILVNYKL